MTSHQLRFTFAFIIFIMAGSPTFFRFGPAVEGYLFPVTTVDFKDPHIEEGRLFFSLGGVKLRVCSLQSLPFAWRYDDTVELAPVYHWPSGEVYNPVTVIASGTFQLDNFYVEIPKVAYGLPKVTFEGVTFHRCHGLWDIPHKFSVDLSVRPDGTGHKLTLLLNE